MVNSPNDIKRDKCKNNDKFEKSFTLKNTERKDKKHTDCHKKEIIKRMFFELFLNVMNQFHNVREWNLE